jgi:calcium-dependent protein kinase
VLRKNYTEKCDIWSCGVLLFILISGVPPFDGPTEQKILEAVIEGNYKFKHPEWTHTSPEVKNLINHMLAYDPMDRFSAKECLEHNWFKILEENDTSSTPNRRSPVLKNLKTFRVITQFSF